MGWTIKGYLEQPTDGLCTQAEETELRGWIAADTRPSEVWLLVDGVLTERLELTVGRPDVAGALGRPPDQVYCFQSTFQLEPFRGRMLQLQLRVIGNLDSYHDLSFRRLVVLPKAHVSRVRFLWARFRLALGSLHHRAGGATPVALLTNLNADLRTLRRTGTVEPSRRPSRCPAPVLIPLRAPSLSEQETFRAEAAQLTPLPTFTLLVPVAAGQQGSTPETRAHLDELPYPGLAVLDLDGRDPSRLASEFAEQLPTCAQWVAFVSPHDRLHPAALLQMAKAILEHPEADVLYSDEDRLIGLQSTSHRYRKPGWSESLLLCQPYTLRFAVYRRALIERIGGLRSEAGAAWEYDLALRATEKARQVVHVPEILIHHVPTGDVPSARCRVVEDAMRRRGMSGTARPSRSFFGQQLRLRPVSSPEVTIIVPTRDRARLLQPCIESVLSSTSYRSFKLLIVDNCSIESETLRLFERWRRDSRVSILRDEQPFHFAALNNAAVAMADTPLVLLLNNDTEVMESRWLSEMVALIEAKDVGAVGARLRYGDGTIQHAGVVLGFGGVAGHGHKRFAFEDPGYQGLVHSIREVSAVTGACLLTRRDLWMELSGMDPRLAVAFNDVDYCLRLREKGYRVLYTPNSTLWHYESVSRGRDQRGQERYEGERRLVQQRHGTALQRDPYFHKDLLLTASNYVESDLPHQTL